MRIESKAQGAVCERVLIQNQGEVEGEMFEEYPSCRYLGIPYAKPPVGSLRFKPPLPPGPFKEKPYIAKSFGHGCVQQCHLQHKEVSCPKTQSEDWDVANAG